MIESDILRLLEQNAPTVYSLVMTQRKHRQEEKITLEKISAPKISTGEDDFIKGLEEDQKRFDSLDRWVEV